MLCFKKQITICRFLEWAILLLKNYLLTTLQKKCLDIGSSDCFSLSIKKLGHNIYFYKEKVMANNISETITENNFRDFYGAKTFIEKSAIPNKYGFKSKKGTDYQGYPDFFME